MQLEAAKRRVTELEAQREAPGNAAPPPSGGYPVFTHFRRELRICQPQLAALYAYMMRQLYDARWHLWMLAPSEF